MLLLTESLSELSGCRRSIWPWERSFALVCSCGAWCWQLWGSGWTRRFSASFPAETLWLCEVLIGDLTCFCVELPPLFRGAVMWRHTAGSWRRWDLETMLCFPLIFTVLSLLFCEPHGVTWANNPTCAARPFDQACRRCLHP